MEGKAASKDQGHEGQPNGGQAYGGQPNGGQAHGGQPRTDSNTSQVLNGKPEPGDVNLIVNYLPNALTDEEFFNLFAKIGLLKSARVMRNRTTGYSYGYGFVCYVDPDNADEAIRQLNGSQLQHKRLKVARCRRGDAGADEIRHANLFVAGLPAAAEERHLNQLFSQFGEIVQCKVLINQATGLSKGCGFVLFSRTAQADAAMALDGVTPDPVDDVTFADPLVVKKARDESRAYAANVRAQQQPLTSARFAGPPVHVMHAPPPGRHPLRFTSAFRSPAVVDPASQLVAKGHLDGHTLHVYGIGSRANELDLYSLFAPFGAVVHVHIQRDLATGQGKGFGFVTFGDFNDASAAAQTLNGFPFPKNQMRALQVSFKTPKAAK